MSLVQTYLDNNGYDYYGNAAEDTLVFFVQGDPVLSSPEERYGRNKEAVINFSRDAVNGVSGGLFSDAAAVNTETHAEAYKKNGKDTSTNSSLGRSIMPAK